MDYHKGVTKKMYFLCEVVDNQNLKYSLGMLIAFNRIKYDQFWVANHRSLKVIEKQMGKSLHVWNDKYKPLWLDDEFTDNLHYEAENQEKEVTKNDTHKTAKSSSTVESQAIGVETHETDQEGRKVHDKDNLQVEETGKVEEKPVEIEETVTEVEEEITDKDVVTPSADKEAVKPKVKKRKNKPKAKES